MRISISYRTLLIVGVAAALLLGTWLLVDWLVVTDSERIHQMLDEATEAVERQDIDFIVDQCLDPDFQLGHLDREKTRDWGKGVIKTYEVQSVRAYSVESTVDGDSAQTTMRTFVKVGIIPGEQRLDWKFQLKRRDNRWGIVRVQVFHFFQGKLHELPLENVPGYDRYF